MSPEEEAKNAAKLRELNARPWRSVCRLCPGMMYCTDTEEEAVRLVTQHVADHHVLVDVWRDH